MPQSATVVAVSKVAHKIIVSLTRLVFTPKAFASSSPKAMTFIFHLSASNGITPIRKQINKTKTLFQAPVFANDPISQKVIYGSAVSGGATYLIIEVIAEHREEITIPARIKIRRLPPVFLLAALLIASTKAIAKQPVAKAKP